MGIGADKTRSKNPRSRGLRTLFGRNDRFMWLLSISTTLLVAVPSMFWTGFLGQQMNIGGDNSLLYFEYPASWLSNTAFPALYQNLGGFNPVPQYAPFAIVMKIIHEIHLNAEGLAFGIVLGGLFLGTVLVVLEIQNLVAPEWGSFPRKASALF